MSCKLNKCSKVAETEDGFCSKHGYYSSVDEFYIVMHIKKYLDEIHNLNGKKSKIKKMMNLWFYLTHKKEFILRNNLFHNTILSKAEELKKDLIKDNFTEELEKFNSLHDQIKSFKK